MRGVGADGVWLGPDLLALIGRETLEALCDAEPAGDTLRLVLREGASLDALEGVLAPVLASKQDWMDAWERCYGQPRNAVTR